MPSTTATVRSTSGLHARPAQLFVEAAAASNLSVTVAVDGRPPVDARSILMVMSLGATCGTRVVLDAEGDGADDTLEHLRMLLETDLDAPGATESIAV